MILFVILLLVVVPVLIIINVALSENEWLRSLNKPSIS